MNSCIETQTHKHTKTAGLWRERGFYFWVSGGRVRDFWPVRCESTVARDFGNLRAKALNTQSQKWRSNGVRLVFGPANFYLWISPCGEHLPLLFMFVTRAWNITLPLSPPLSSLPCTLADSRKAKLFLHNGNIENNLTSIKVSFLCFPVSCYFKKLLWGENSFSACASLKKCANFVHFVQRRHFWESG